jgi:hypothetical protein
MSIGRQRIEVLRFTYFNYSVFPFLVKFKLGDSAYFRSFSLFCIARSPLRDLLSAHPNTASQLPRYRKVFFVSFLFSIAGAVALAVPIANEFAEWSIAKWHEELCRVALSIKPGTAAFRIIKEVGALPLDSFLAWSRTSGGESFLVTTGLSILALGFLLNYDCYRTLRQMIEIYNRPVSLSPYPSSQL